MTAARWFLVLGGPIVVGLAVLAGWLISRRRRARRRDPRQATALAARKALRDLRKQADKRDKARGRDVVGMDNGPPNTWGGGHDGL